MVTPFHRNQLTTHLNPRTAASTSSATRSRFWYISWTRPPPEADRVFAEAEAGETAIQTPSTALAEVLFSVSRDERVPGVELSGSSEHARRALVETGPVSVARDGDEVMVEYAAIVDEFSIHDDLIVASHHAHGTEAVITADGVVRDAAVPTVWN